MDLRHVGIAPERYLKFIILPSVFLAVIFLVFLLTILKPIMELLGLFSVLLYFVPLLVFLIALLYPKIVEGRLRNQIENNIHLYITHMGTLATSEIDRKRMMEILMERKEYKALAEETRKIYILMAKWNRNLSQACRFLAKRTPSRILADFLDRMAHEIDSGEDFKDFIKREQKIIMDAFTTMYQGKLYSIDIFKEIYVSIILSLSFFAAFAIIMPFLTGINVMMTLYLIVIFFVITEIGVLTYLRAVAPDDNVWQMSGRFTKVDRKLYKIFSISLIVCLIIFTITLVLSYIYKIVEIPVPFIVSLSVTPLFIPGIFAKKEESLIHNKDKNAPSFIMSLGASASARGGDILESLKYLTAHDFGSLTNDIRALYKRLVTKINKKLAWQIFSIETGSNLIYRFTDMFIEAISIGSDPKEVAEIVSKNFTTMNNLRARRLQSAGSFTGIAYGVIIGIAFTLYISFGLIESMSELYSSLEISQEYIGSILYIIPKEDLSFMNFAILFILFFHAVLSSISLKLIDGGRFMGGLVHTVGMIWLAAISGFASQQVITNLISIK
ncbi:hypothetical protein DRO97_03800 [Archaeoglobales archaeon]|nr:MAG: hypothetical protein DRO97_03800 [Archaeoglobales archaeon]